jgi:hypothetical protein
MYVQRYLLPRHDGQLAHVKIAGTDVGTNHGATFEVRVGLVESDICPSEHICHVYLLL